MLTGFTRSRPSSTAVDMIVRNRRYTFATVFGARWVLWSCPCHERTAVADMSRSRAWSNVPSIQPSCDA